MKRREQQSLLKNTSNSFIDPKENEEQIRLNRLASIGELSAGIAHEVRNPLTAVKGFLQLMKEMPNESYLDTALTELDSALLTLNNLLQVSKPDLEEEKHSAINVSTELENILYLFQDQVYRIQMTKEFDDCDTIIFGQRNMIKKAFFNLIKNALEAMPDKGELTITHRVSDDKLTIKITDTGIGIPPEKLDLIGTPFFSTKESGTGMGLTQVFTTLHKHNARVKVFSQVNIGTTFEVEFPVSNKKMLGVVEMVELVYKEGQTFHEFILENKDEFDKQVSRLTKDSLNKIQGNSPISEAELSELAYSILEYVDENNDRELSDISKTQGMMWAKANLPLVLKLEWFQELRIIYWDYFYNYYKNLDLKFDEFFSVQKKTNFYLDAFLNNYTISYNNYRSQVLQSQLDVIEDLTVPMIPISDSVAILPVVGTMDTQRAKKLQEKTLKQIEQFRINHIILDLSGVAYMDTAVVAHIFRVVDGYKLLGCKTIVTGIRPEIANTMVELGIEIDGKFSIKGDLKQALEDFNLIAEA